MKVVGMATGVSGRHDGEFFLVVEWTTDASPSVVVESVRVLFLHGDPKPIREQKVVASIKDDVFAKLGVVVSDNDILVL